MLKKSNQFKIKSVNKLMIQLNDLISVFWYFSSSPSDQITHGVIKRTIFLSSVSM